MADEDKGEDEDIVCVHCLSSDASEGNDILICEGMAPVVLDSTLAGGS